MNANFKNLSYTDLGQFLHKLPSISVDDFKLTDRSISSYFLVLDVDLHSYIIKMERVESWTLDTGVERGKMVRDEVQRTYTGITEAFKKLGKLEINNDACKQIFILLSALGSRRFVYAIKFLTDQQPDLLQNLYENDELDSKETDCLKYRLNDIYRAAEIIRIYSGQNLEQIHQILMELQNESV